MKMRIGWGGLAIGLLAVLVLNACTGNPAAATKTPMATPTSMAEADPRKELRG